MGLIYNTPPRVLTLSAVAVGYLLLQDDNANEQNALGNWLMLVAQMLCTNAYFNQLQNPMNTNNATGSKEDTIRMLKKMVDALNIEIEELKRNM